MSQCKHETPGIDNEDERIFYCILEAGHVGAHEYYEEFRPTPSVSGATTTTSTPLSDLRGMLIELDAMLVRPEQRKKLAIILDWLAVAAESGEQAPPPTLEFQKDAAGTTSDPETAYPEML